MNVRTIKRIAILIAVVCLVVQVVHFNEHIVQVSVWAFGRQDKPYMTTLGMWAMHKLGALLFPTASHARQAHLGLEALHLVGNGIFLVGIGALYYLVRVKRVFWAGVVELFHCYEHISLTVSAIAIGKSIGMSTFYGLPVDPWLLVAYRVWWHFIFNLIPSVLVFQEVWPRIRQFVLQRKSV